MTANTSRSKKQKGTRLEQKVAGEIRHRLKINAQRMPLSGAISHFRGDIYAPQFPFVIECKNQEKVKIWEWWKQARSQAGLRKPMLVFSGNHRPILAVVRLEDILDLQAEVNDLYNERKKDIPRFGER